MLPSLLLVALLAKPVPQDSPEPVLERMAEVYQDLRTLEAAFTRVKSYPQLDLTDPPEKGVLFLERDGEDERKVRVEITEPEIRIAVVENGNYLLYQPRIKQAIEGRLGEGTGGGSGFVNYFLGDLSAAREDYEVTSLGDEPLDGRKTVHLRLLPKPGGRAYFLQVDLWVDPELGMPIQQEFVEPNRSLLHIRFDQIRINPELKDDLFEIDLPPGVERVKG